MKSTFYTLLLLTTAGFTLFSQTQIVIENSKWGIKENDSYLIQPVYDTIFNFDSTQQVCLACFKIKQASASKFIKTTRIYYSCNYLNKQAQRLIVRNVSGDTCSLFSLNKTTVNNYLQNQELFAVTSKGKKNLVKKNFKQFTFKGYSEITPSEDKNLFYTQIVNDADVTVSSIINPLEQELVPYHFSAIKLNTDDSLIIACSAGVYITTEDAVYDFDGRKKESSHRHIDFATKHFLIHKFFEPKEYFVFYNIETKEEVKMNCEEVKPHKKDEILIRIKKDWYLYDLKTNQKVPYKHS